MAAPREPLQNLLLATGQGEHAAFARLYERTHLHLFGVAHRMLGGQHAAEDCLQDSFVSIWKSAHTYRPDGIAAQAGDSHVMTWLIAVVRNKALDMLRSRVRRKEDALPEQDLSEDETALPGAELAASSLEQLTQALQAAHIEQCMAALDGGHRQSLALAYYQGLSHSEVAAQMGAPLGSVKAWIRRGLDKLKDCLAARCVAGAGV
jgi:RNA polymerase sigma-70 factor, ECF subfamily